MRFLSMIRVAETGQQPSERLMNEMGKLIEEMTRDDEWNLECEVRPLDGEEFCA